MARRQQLLFLCLLLGAAAAVRGARPGSSNKKGAFAPSPNPKIQLACGMGPPCAFRCTGGCTNATLTAHKVRCDA